MGPTARAVGLTGPHRARRGLGGATGTRTGVVGRMHNDALWPMNVPMGAFSSPPDGSFIGELLSAE